MLRACRDLGLRAVCYRRTDEILSGLRRAVSVQSALQADPGHAPIPVTAAGLLALISHLGPGEPSCCGFRRGTSPVGSLASADHRENPVPDSDGSVLRVSFVFTDKPDGVRGAVFTPLSHAERGHRLHGIRGEDLLADGADPVLSAPHDLSARGHSGLLVPAAGMWAGDRVASAQTVCLHGLVLVSGNAGSGHRSGSDRYAAHGRSLYLSASDRDFSARRLAGGRPGAGKYAAEAGAADDHGALDPAADTHCISADGTLGR